MPQRLKKTWNTDRAQPVYWTFFSRFDQSEGVNLPISSSPLLLGFVFGVQNAPFEPVPQRKNLSASTGRIIASRMSTWWFDFQYALNFFFHWTWYARYYNVRRIMCLAWICTYRVLLPLLLLLRTGALATAAVVVRGHVPDGKYCSWFIASDSTQGFISLHSNTICF